MKLTPEQMRDYNVKAAELLELNRYDEDGGVTYYEPFRVSTVPTIHRIICEDFNFFTNAADKDMLVEKLRIRTSFDDDINKWKATRDKECYVFQSWHTGESMTAAQIACIVACLDCDSH